MSIYENNNAPPVFCFRVFVNRSLSLDKINFFGFDMDYTLAGTLAFIVWLHYMYMIVCFYPGENIN